MPTIKTRVGDATYAKLVAKRKAAGLPSVSAFLLKAAGVLTDEAEATEIVRLALQRAKRKSSGSEYLLRDLFPDNRWAKFSKGARLRAGKMFNAEVSTAIHGVRATRKSSTNYQYYQTS